jgi:hypothetical protein
VEQKPVAAPDSEIIAVLLLAADAAKLLEIAPAVVAFGFTRAVQAAPWARVVVPLMQVPPLSKVKVVVFDSDRLTTEDV